MAREAEVPGSHPSRCPGVRGEEEEEESDVYDELVELAAPAGGGVP